MRTESCDGWNGTVLWISFGLIFIALVVFVLFSFLQRRRRLKRNCCCGAPGLFPPLDFLTGHPSRLVLTLTLMALSGHVVQNAVLQPVVFINHNETVTQITSAIIRMAWIVYASFLFLPSVTCSATSLPILGYAIGAIYTGSLIVWYLLWVYSFQRGCIYFAIKFTADTPEISTTIIGIAPVILCLVGVLLWYIVSFVHEIIQKIKGKTSWVHSDPTLHFNSYKYLRHLLKSRGTREEATESKSFFSKMKRKIYTSRPGFAYPLRVIVSLGGASIVLFELSFLCITRFLSLTDNLLINLDNITNNSCTDHTNITEMMDLNISSSSSSLLCNFLERRHDIINGLSVFLIMGPFIAFPLTLLHLIPIMKNVRTHLLKGYKGDKSFLPEGVTFTPAFIIASTLKYPGYQIGYITLGWILYALTVWLFGILLLVTVFAFVYAYTAVLLIISSIILTIIINILIQFIQSLTGRFLFIEGKEQRFVLTNRRLYHITSYLLYCYNGLLGLGSSIGRTVIAAGQGLVLAPRLDITGIKKSKIDKGHLTYLGFIQLELIQNNAIAHVFIDMLSRIIEERKRKTINKERFGYITQGEESTGERGNSDRGRGSHEGERESVVLPINGANGVEALESYSDERPGHSKTITSTTLYDIIGGSRPHVSTRAYNRWHVVYVLLKNPSIRDTRRSMLSELK